MPSDESFEEKVIRLLELILKRLTTADFRF
jgi:hypothetical protein